MEFDTRSRQNHRARGWGRLPGLRAMVLAQVLLLVSGAVLVGRVAPPEPRATTARVAVASDATIRRDEYGVPHITAPTEEAAAFAHGYAVAEDHLEDLAVLFLRARGELASVFGESRVSEDLQVLGLGIPQQAADHFTRVSEGMRRILEGYAAGYNRYLKEAGGRAPAWARPITGRDVLAHCRAVYLLNFSPPPSMFSDAFTSAPSASNFWAIAPGKSRSGRALLLANPHLPWRGPYVMHEVHLRVPGTIDVAGAALIGFPVVTIGFNARLGWTHTGTSKSWAEQLYRVALDPADPQKYLLQGRSVPFTVTTTVLRVKAAAGEETRRVDTAWSEYGPIIHKSGGHAYAFNSPNLGILDFLTEYNQMAKAQSLEQFQAALQMQQLPIMGVGYADREGNILYVQNGRYPQRGRRPEGQRWLTGDPSEGDPHAILPQTAIPQLLNPKGHYVQNANNGFAYTTLAQPIDMNAYVPAVRISNPLALRAQLSLDMLEKRARFSLDDVARAAFDPTVPLAARVKPELVRLVKADAAAPPEVLNAARVLDDWDGRIGPESAGATLFTSWWAAYLRARPSKVHTREWDSREPIQTPTGIGDPRVAVEAFTQTVAALTKAFGTPVVPWKQVFRLKRGSVDVPAPGASDTLGCFNALEFSRDDDVRRSVSAGTSYVLAVEFGETPTAMSVLPYSQSADPASRHYNDQTALFGRGALKRFWLTEAEIEQHTVRRYTPGM